jgi:hypothetical protein
VAVGRELGGGGWKWNRDILLYCPKTAWNIHLFSLAHWIYLVFHLKTLHRAGGGAKIFAQVWARRWKSCARMASCARADKIAAPQDGNSCT